MSIPVAKQYIKDFEQMGLGVFVHFGIYSIVSKGEWHGYYLKGNSEKIAEYKALKYKFNPDSMENIVLEAKKAGAKYITLTTKHHDGFALFDTCGITDFDAMHSAAKRDLVKEFVEACRKHDIVPMFYYATHEFFNDDEDNNFPKYLEYIRNSVEVLCKNYGKIGGLWFDGNWSKTGEGDVWEEEKLYALIRKYQGEAMIINNTGLQRCGEVGNLEIDSVTYERGKAAPLNREGMKKYVAAEVCDSSNGHWGIANDFNHKSPKYILECLCKSRGAGANYLFNVGPEASGHVPSFQAALLGLIGEWMSIFGEAIYNGRPFWYNEKDDNFVLKSVDGKHAYFVCFDLLRRGSANVTYLSGKEGAYSYENFTDRVENIRWMDNDEQLDYSYDGDTLTVNLAGYDYGYDYCVRIAKADIK